MTFEEWTVFMAIWVAASVPLGPNALNCISATASQGIGAGFWSVLGVTLAAMLHMTLAVSGLAAFMAAHPGLFEVLRWAGVGYLVWMGFAMLRSSGELNIPLARRAIPANRLVSRAILISLGNPKAIFVWLAIFSQFIDPAVPLGGQLLILAPSALSITIAVYGGYAIMGLSVRRVFAGRRKLWFDRLAGTTYLGFAASLATADLRRT